MTPAEALQQSMQHEVPATIDAPKLSRVERLDICRACDQHQNLPGGMMRCRACGCICQFKTAIPAASCPLKKW